MIAFLTLCYCGFIWLIFVKLKLLPFNRGAKITVVTVGVVAIFGLLVAMNLCQPYSTDATITVYTTPIVPRVSGRVVEVAVKPNVPLEEGDVLFKLDPDPFQAQVDRLRASLAEAEQNVAMMQANVEAAGATVSRARVRLVDAQQSAQMLQANLDAAQATVSKAKAQAVLAQIDYDHVREAAQIGATAKFELDKTKAALDTANAALLETEALEREARLAVEAEIHGVNTTIAVAQAELEEAEAAEKKARLALASEIDGENTTVARIRAELRAAQIDLAECTVYAPADGYVTHFFLKPGAVATKLSLSPVMTFVYSGEQLVVATFSANVQRNIKVDDPAEITLDTNPGVTLKAKVHEIIPASGEGALAPTGELLRTSDIPQKGRIFVAFRFAEDVSGIRAPAGTGGAVAIYTDRAAVISIVRRVVIRMTAWLNYLPA